MKRLFFTLVMISILSLVFATESPSDFPTDGVMFTPFQAGSAKSSAMGNTSIALDGRYDTLLRNPANAADGFQLSIPTMTITTYNLEANSENFMNLLKSGFTNEDLVKFAIDGLNNIPGGVKDFISLDIGASAAFPYIAVSYAFNTNIFTFGPGDLSSNLGVDMNAALSLILSHKFSFDFGMDLSLGAKFSYVYKNITADSTYLSGIGATIISDIISNSPDFSNMGQAIVAALSDIPVSTGNAFPMSFGLKMSLPLGFSFGLVLDNVNGNYTMQEGQDSFIIKTPMSLDIGFALNPIDNFFINPVLSCELLDLVGLYDGYAGQESFADHLRIGIEVETLRTIFLRGGLDRGYLTAGVGFDFYALSLDFSYGRKAYGLVARGESLDYFKIGLNLGYDR